jgi:hypothetical protein
MNSARAAQVDLLLNAAHKALPADKAAAAARGDVGEAKRAVRDIINKCLSETQKLHVGSSVAGHDSTLLLDILEALRDVQRGRVDGADAPPRTGS